MKRYISLLFLFLPLMLSAQRPEMLAEADNLTKGVLPNGISYYLVCNNDIKGYADFSLIQQGMASSTRANELLSGMENFKQEPYKFLSSNGIAYTRDGYVTAYGKDAVIRLRDVPVYDSAVTDSTLLLLFGLMGTSPAEQALVICGDIDSPKMLQQIKTLSLSLPERSAITEEPPYAWEPSGTPEIICRSGRNDAASTVTLSYARPRTPRTHLSGTRPHISKVLSGQLGTILSERIKAAFREKGIPVSGLRTYDIGSSETGGDESFNLTLSTAPEHLEEALKAISGVLASIDIDGASPQELQLAKGASSWSLRHSAAKGSTISNGEYSELCIASYLYGAPLVARNAVRNYFAGRALDPEVELSVFNKFASAVLSPTDNLTVTVTAPGNTAEAIDIKGLLSGNWKSDPGASVSRYALLQAPARLKKTKVKSTLTDPVTSGTIWTFANGFKLIYKNIPGNGGISYALTLRGGISLIPELEAGEYAFADDVLGLFRIAGSDAGSFRKALLAEGVSFVPKVGISDFTISGETSADKIETVMTALALYANRRQVDAQAFRYYRDCKSLEAGIRETGEEGIRDRMKDMSFEDNPYSSSLHIGNLSGSLPEKLDRYLDLMFSKTDDGSLIVIGDIDQNVLLNTVSRYAGLFGTGRKAPAKAREPYEIVSGWNTRSFDTSYTVMDDDVRGVYVMLNTYYPFSIKNSIASEIACEAIKLKLNRILADYGMYASLDKEIYMSPSEMLGVFISCKPCNTQGLPSAVSVQKTEKALGAIRNVITTLSLTEISAGLLETSKSNIGYRYASQLANPSSLMDAALIRNSLGMNVISGYRPALESVRESDVRAVLESLDKAAKVEFIYK